MEKQCMQCFLYFRTLTIFFIFKGERKVTLANQRFITLADFAEIDKMGRMP